MTDAIRQGFDQLTGDAADGGRVVVFDAMGTLFDLGAIDPRFEQLGVGPATREAWFGRLLDTSKALTIVGEFEPFDKLALSTLRTTLAGQGLDPDAAERIVAALAEVPAYPDAAAALERIAETGLPMVVLTNGGAEQTNSLLERAGLAGHIDRVFATEEVRAYKPDARTYRRVCEQLRIDAGQCVLVAAHGWDVLGATAIGFEAIWIDRIEHCWPIPSGQPRRRARDLAQAAEFLVAGAAPARG